MWFLFLFFNYLWKIQAVLPGYGYSSHNRSATHCYQCVQYFWVYRQWYWYGCQVFGIVNVHADGGACDCTQRLCELHKRVCMDKRFQEKNLLPHQGVEPMSVLCLAFLSDSTKWATPCPISIAVKAFKVLHIWCVRLFHTITLAHYLHHFTLM